MSSKKRPLAPENSIAGSILVLRGQKVLLDMDLAELYGVSTKALNQAVRRNAGRFPTDFIFRLTRQELDILNRSQNVTGSLKHRNPRFPPVAFTEHGAIMAAAILNSSRAVEASVYVVRAFVQLRALLSTNRELAHRLSQLDLRISKKLAKHDDDISAIVELIRQLMAVPESRRRPIGFTADLDENNP